MTNARNLDEWDKILADMDDETSSNKPDTVHNRLRQRTDVELDDAKRTIVSALHADPPPATPAGAASPDALLKHTRDSTIAVTEPTATTPVKSSADECSVSK
jgi:hypothetical protein